MAIKVRMLIEIFLSILGSNPAPGFEEVGQG